MTLYQVSDEWENNGYSDSDFYIVAFDDEKNELERIEVHSTRYAAGRGYTGIIRKNNVPEEVWSKAESALARLISRNYLLTVKHLIEFPKTINQGEAVILVKEVKNRPRHEVKQTCFKCNGSGNWVNPRNSNDKRSCFTCEGSGYKIQSTATKGKLVAFPVGTRAKVKTSFQNTSKYGTWNYGDTVICVTEDGKEFRSHIRNLNLDIQIPTQEECDKIGIERAKHRDFYSQFATSTISMI